MLGCRGRSFYENFWQVEEGMEGEEFLKRLAFRVELLRYRGTSLFPSPSIPSHPFFTRQESEGRVYPSFD